MKKYKLIIILVLLVLFLTSVTNTYSRYVNSYRDNINIDMKSWDIVVNNEDISSNDVMDLDISPVIDSSNHVIDGKVAPSSTGYYDISINPSNIDLSFEYSINFSILDESNIKDLVVTDYAITSRHDLDNNVSLTKISCSDNTINHYLEYNNTSYSEYILRVFFKWNDDSDNVMNDESDTEVGYNSVTDDSVGNNALHVSISFKQCLNNNCNGIKIN